MEDSNVVAFVYSRDMSTSSEWLNSMSSDLDKLLSLTASIERLLSQLAVIRSGLKCILLTNTAIFEL